MRGRTLLSRPQAACLPHLPEGFMQALMPGPARGFLEGEATAQAQALPPGLDSGLPHEVHLDEAPRALRKVNMAKRRKRRVSLGDPPRVHARALRKAIQHYRQSADSALRAAQGGRCLIAAEDFEEAHRWRGYVQAHSDSLGSKRRFAARTVNLTPIAQMMIAARKAMEVHCGREPAVRKG